MLTKQNISVFEIASLSTQGMSIEQLLDNEYFLTNTRGGYSASTVIGCNTRRYHGLLIGTMNPPANRIMGLSNLMELVIVGGNVVNLSTFEFPEIFIPCGHHHIKQFTRDIGAHFEYEFSGVELTKSVYLKRDEDTVFVQYDFKTVPGRFDFIVRPFLGLRDFHCMQKSHASLKAEVTRQSLKISHDTPDSCEMLLSCSEMKYEKDPQWWFNFVYREDRRRGQDHCEDLWAPGFYKCTIRKPGSIIFKATIGTNCDDRHFSKLKIKNTISELEKVQRSLLKQASSEDTTISKLALAADQFICRRTINDKTRSTLLAGYPWFFDWGRDAFISLPGLLLETGRYEDACSVLTTFAAAVDNGMIPNRFDDRSNTAHFNSIDASLWFINAAFEYLNVTDDEKTFKEQLLGVICEIVEKYQAGTHFDIHADIDGLILGGNEQTQLTWMDAKFGGKAFTPRHGKAVELNALWHNALRRLAYYYEMTNVEKADGYNKMAQQVAESFRAVFWNSETGYLNDCVSTKGWIDISCRPNQIFAVSLEYSPLTEQQQKQIVEVVEQELLTPYGLRSLSPKDDNYKGLYRGTQHTRDESYHQGTAWGYLMGYFVEAYLRVNEFSAASREKCREFIEPLIEHLNTQKCLGSVSEIFDGDEPHKARGCFAQAWSVGELIRAIKLINS